MNTVAENISLVDQEKAVSDPGRRLREAREQLGLSLEDVSARLHLDRHIIEKLEADEFGQLPAPTFIRGYLNSYARFLELPLRPIIEAFDSHKLKPPLLIADIATSQETRSSDLLMRLATGVIITLSVLLSVVWWQNQRVDVGVDPLTKIDSSKELEAAQESLPEIDALEEEQETTLAFPSPEEQKVAGLDDEESIDAAEPEALPGAASSAPDALTLSSEVAAGDADTSGSIGQISASELIRLTSIPGLSSTKITTHITTPTTDNTLPLERANRSAESVPDATQGISSPSDALAQGDGRISLRFKANSWVEIYDANDQPLYFNLAKAGSEINVSGPLPLRMLIGYVKGVELRYNGQLYDFSKHISRGVARFELGR